jgi:7-cyano-7-deazaguanine synthase
MAGEVSCVVLLSGGMDSTTLLALAKKQYDKVAALSIDYAQRHKRELECAIKVAEYYKVPHKILDISNINSLIQGSSLTSDNVEVPHGHYEDESMKLTVVPARNTILLSIAGGWAISMGFTHVAYAAHAGDHAIYPDCREAYVQALQQVFNVFHYWPINIWAPFLGIDKGDIAKLGVAADVPFELTHTCYEGNEVACGKCGSCQERLYAFKQAGVDDPVKYAS